jgi:hypothetical protein
MAVIFQRKPKPTITAPETLPPSGKPMPKGAPPARASVMPGKAKPMPPHSQDPYLEGITAKLDKPPVQLAAPGKIVKLSQESTKVKPELAAQMAQAKVADDMPAVPAGGWVEITSEMFPWVKHYKPGDKAVVLQVMNTSDPLGISTNGSHRLHILRIEEPTEPARKGFRAALFRWEFKPIPAPK